MSDREWQQEEARQLELNAARAEAVLAFAESLREALIRDGSWSTVDPVEIAQRSILMQGWSLPAAERTKP